VKAVERRRFEIPKKSWHGFCLVGIRQRSGGKAGRRKKGFALEVKKIPVEEDGISNRQDSTTFVPPLTNDMEQEPVREYERKMKSYEEKKSAFQRRHPEFGAEMAFVGWGEVLVGIIGWLIFPVIGTIIGVMGWQSLRKFIWNREQDKLYREFESKTPIPIPPKPVEFDLELDESRFEEATVEKNYRQQILVRDDYTCQNCDEQFSDEDLEVHHVKSRAQGGTNHRTNLVTLCKSCHDREKWFGHKRMYPTTL